MKLLSFVPLLLGLVLAGCTSEASTSATNAANKAADAAKDAANAAKDAAGAASSMATAAASKALEQVKTTLAGITSVDTAKSAVPGLTNLIPSLTSAVKGVAGTWPAELTKLADGIREQVTRLSAMPDVKGVLGGLLDQITNLLPKK